MSKKTHKTTERVQGNLRLSEAKPMVPQNDGTCTGEPEAERSEADGSTKRRNVYTSVKKFQKFSKICKILVARASEACLIIKRGKVR